VTLTYADFIEPDGRLQEALFPAGNINSLVATWLARAEVKVTAADVETAYYDGAAEAYVYYLAYSHVADRLAGMPNKVAIDSGADVETSIEKDRIAYFRGLAQDYLDQFNEYVGQPPERQTPRSGWVQNQVIF
jgi:hypothetical protein